MKFVLGLFFASFQSFAGWYKIFQKFIAKSLDT